MIVKIELKFHYDTRFDYVRWRESLGSTNAERREWEQLFLSMLTERLEAFRGVPPEAERDEFGRYGMQFTDRIRIRYEIVPEKRQRIFSIIERLFTQRVVKIIILNWDGNAF